MKTRFTLAAVILLTVSTFTFGCSESKAAVNARTFNENFYGIILNGNANVYLMQDETSSVRVEGSVSSVEEVQTTISNGALVINSGSLRNVNIYITMTDITLLQVNGSGVIHAMSTLNSDMLLLKITGSGIIRADVRALSVGMIINGGGRIYTSGVTGDSFVKVRGSGEVVSMNLDSIRPTSTADYAQTDIPAERKLRTRKALTMHQ